MKAIGILTIGVLALALSLTVACGGDDENDGNTGIALPPAAGGGLVARDVHMTYDGRQYELVNMLFEDMVSEGEFQALGDASESDVDMKGDSRVYRRTGDETLVYTHAPPTADDQGMWLAWRVKE